MKKGFILFMAFAMVAAFSFVPSTGQAAADGDLITGSGSAVYYLNGGKRYVFPNQKTYMTWYPDFSGVVTVSDSELSSYPLGGNVTYRAGTQMVKIDTVPTVYAVEPGGVLRSIVSEANAVALFGSDWNTKIDDVPDAFWVNYTVGDALTAGMYPSGTLVKEVGSATTYYIDGTEKRPVATGEAFDANMFNWAFLQSASSLTGYTDGTSITGAESGLMTVAGTGGGVVGGSVTVSLAADTPASTTYLGSQARAPFLAVNVTNNSAADVTIDSIIIERGGLAVDADFATVAIVEDSPAGSQTGLNKTFNSDHRATVGDDIVVAAGTTKKIYVVGNMAASGTMTAGDTPKLGIYSMTVKSGSSLSGSFPIWGNEMSLNTGVGIATATIAAGGSNPGSDAAPKVGDTDVEVAQVKVTNDSSTEKVQIEKIVFKQAGTASDSDVGTYSLYDSSDGTKLATAAQVDKYIEFNLSPAFELGKSKNNEFMVKVDEVEGGSGRTIQLDIHRNTDVLVKGLVYNSYVIPTFPATSQPYFNNTTDHNIGDGSLKVEPDSTFVAANIAEGQDGTQIGQWIFTVKGEAVDITAMEALCKIGNAGGDISDMTSGIFYNVDTGAGLTGADDVSGQTTTSAEGGVTSTDTVSLDVGVHKVGLKVNLSSDFSTNQTIQCEIDPDTWLDTTGQVTGNTITESPTASQQSALMTIKAATLAISMSNQPAAATVIRGTNNVEFANVQLDASGSGDDLTVTQIKTDIRTKASGNYPAELSNLKLWDGDTEVTVSNDPDPTSTTAGASATTTWSISPAITVAKGTVKVLTITANIASTPSADETFQIGGASNVTSKDSEGEDVTETYNYGAGSTMTIATGGSLTFARSDTNTNTLLSSNKTGVELGKITATALYENANIEKLYVDFTAFNSGGTDELLGYYLYDGATQIAEATITSSDASTLTFNMESDPFVVPVNETKELTIKADTADASKSGIATNASPYTGFNNTVTAANAVVKGASGTTITPTSATLTFPTYALVKSAPTVTIASTGDSVTSNGDYDLIDVTVAADSSGPVGLYKMSFKVTTTTVTADDFTLYEGSNFVTKEFAASQTVSGVRQSEDGTGTGYTLIEVLFFDDDDAAANVEMVSAGSSKTYTLKASVTGYDSSTSNGISTSMLGDDTKASTSYNKNAVAVDALDDDDFIWSDLSYGNTTTTATVTMEWLNGYLVDGLVSTTSSAKSI
jgi:hypothetical protein